MLLTIAFQGIPGSFSHAAALKHFGPKFHSYHGQNFLDIFTALDQNKADFAVVPIKNSTIGNIPETQLLLKQYPITVETYVTLKVEHNLLVKPEFLSQKLTVRDLTKVFSHPKALAQCTQFFAQHRKVKPEPFADTARAAQFVSQQKSLKYAAIGSTQAAEFYHLAILIPHLEDRADNTTTFAVISRKKA
jgi:prephenate dehydratase